MRNLEAEIRDLKEQVKILNSIVIEGKPYNPGEREFDRAMQEFLDGNPEPIKTYFLAKRNNPNHKEVRP